MQLRRSDRDLSEIGAVAWLRDPPKKFEFRKNKKSKSKKKKKKKTTKINRKEKMIKYVFLWEKSQRGKKRSETRVRGRLIRSVTNKKVSAGEL